MTLTARLQPKKAMITLCFLAPDIDVLRRGKQNEVF